MPALIGAKPWHVGERAAHEKRGYSLFVGNGPNSMLEHLDDHHAEFHNTLLTMPLTTIDSDGRPWASLVTNDGHRGFINCKSIHLMQMNIRPTLGDPIVQNLCSGQTVFGHKLIAGVGIEFLNRRRNKFAGYIKGTQDCNPAEDVQVKVDININSAMGNCPKYINIRTLEPISREPVLISNDITWNKSDESLSYKVLPDEAIEHIRQADTTFLATRYLPMEAPEESHLGCNHRGGKPGFVRVDLERKDTVYVPDFSGNRLLQSIGNIQSDPYAGLTFPNFLSGDMLYITGDATILYGKESQDIMRGVSSVIQIRITGYRHVKNALPLIQQDETTFSAYDPPIKYLANEPESGAGTLGNEQIKASLKGVKFFQQDGVADSAQIARFTFQTSKSIAFKPGQHAIIDFSSLISPRAKAYQHMASSKGGEKELNDDGVRTWTISNKRNNDNDNRNNNNIELTMRIQPGGAITPVLFAFGNAINERFGGVFEGDASLELPLVGISGSFVLPSNLGTDDTATATTNLVFIGNGIGITPYLSMTGSLHDMFHSKLAMKARVNIDLVLSVRIQEDKIFEDMIKSIFDDNADDDKDQQSNSNSSSPMLSLTVHLLNKEFPASMPSVNFTRGSLTKIQIRRYQHRLEDQTFVQNKVSLSNDIALASLVYICGNKPFETTVRHALQKVSYPIEKIVSESFDY